MARTTRWTCPDRCGRPSVRRSAAEEPRQSPAIGKRSVMLQPQVLHHRAHQAKLDRFAAARCDLACPVEDFGIDTVEGEHTYANRAPHLGQTSHAAARACVGSGRRRAAQPPGPEPQSGLGSGRRWFFLLLQGDEEVGSHGAKTLWTRSAHFGVLRKGWPERLELFSRQKFRQRELRHPP